MQPTTSTDSKLEPPDPSHFSFPGVFLRINIDSLPIMVGILRLTGFVLSK